MSQNIRTFLRKQQALNNGRELWNILGNLPSNTPVYQYQSLAHTEAIIHSLNVDKIEFCVFINVPENLLDHDERKFGISKLYPHIATAVAKMPTGRHCVAARRFDAFMREKVRDMGIDPDAELEVLGSSTAFHKEPDSSYLPHRLPAGRTADWPSIVLEVGWMQSHDSLMQVARQWLQASRGQIRSVITIKIARTLCTIKSYVRRGNGHIQVTQTITMRRNRQNRCRIIGGPLTVPFEHLFLRQPTHGQQDIVLTEADLRTLASGIWHQFPPKISR